MRSDKYHKGVPADHFRKGIRRPMVIHDPKIAELMLVASRVDATMMASAPTAPGVYVTVGSAAPSPGTQPRTGTWFVTGEAQQGPVGVAIPITSMTDYLNFLGTRPSYTTLYDSLDEFFHDGGSLAYVSRIVGPTPVSAHLTLVDRAGSPLSTLSVNANGGGVWGNSCTVAVANGSASNSFVLTIVNPISAQTWISPNLFSPADAVTWATNLAGSAPWAFPFTITNSGSATAAPNNNPAVISATALASGVDDLSNVVEAQWTAGLVAFGSNLGPGQVSAPGHTTAAGYQALNLHASLTDAAGALVNNRFALLDDADTATASSIVTQVGTAQISPVDNGFAMMLAPWVIIPGIPGTVGSSPAAATRTIPPSALVAALMAANDQANTADVPAAGPNGISSFATGVTQSYSETDRGTLNTAGCSVVRILNGQVQLYGYRTVATNPAWSSGGFARMRMELNDALNTAAQGFAFAQIDGQGHLLSHFNGTLAGICAGYWAQGALFGATANDAFQVNTSSVNTPATAAAGQLNATVSVRFSAFAEFVQISVVNFSVSQSLPA